MLVREHTEGQRERPLTGECAWGRWRTAVQAYSIGQVQVVILDRCRPGLSFLFEIQIIEHLNMKYLICYDVLEFLNFAV